MDTNSIADAMLDIQDLPQAYTPSPGAELHSQYLVSQIEQLRDINNTLIEDNRSLRETILSKDRVILQKDQMIHSLLERQMTNPPAQSHPAEPPPPPIFQAGSAQPGTSRLRTKDPDVWSGTKSTLPRFLASCRAKFLIEEHNFTNEFIKIGYAGSFLGGPPSDWWHTLFQRYEESQKNGTTPPAELTSFSEFANALTNSYGDPDLTGTMERELRTLRQTSSVSAYAAEFQRIAGFLTAAGWNDRPLLSNFRANLKDNIKNVLVHEKPFPTTLQEMIAASIRIDNREQEKAMDRKVQTHQSGAQGNQSRSHQNGPSRLQITAPPNPTAPTLPLPVTTPLANNDGTTPMELDAFERRVLSDTEKEFRRNNKLCLYCGSPNHRVADCPKVPEKNRFNNRRINFITELPDSDTASTNARAQE
jgi:hypothetical protein